MEQRRGIDNLGMSPVGVGEERGVTKDINSCYVSLVGVNVGRVIDKCFHNKDR